METDTLLALSPVDGRYCEKTRELKDYFSEYALMYYRVVVEIAWLRKLRDVLQLELSDHDLDLIQDNFSLNSARNIKEFEKTTNHDVKAVELFVRCYIPQKYKEFVHFGATSEDINNCAYACMINQGSALLELDLYGVSRILNECSEKWKHISILARTHGQPASPTTVGKEFRVFVARLWTAIATFCDTPICAKFNGATGTLAALYTAYPDKPWWDISQQFVTELGFTPWDPTTQIEPQDYMVDLFDCLRHINNILIDLCRDIWGYIALDYFKQKVVEGEVGSSTMPHKVNPIDFENAEANLGVANALLYLFSEKLPKSRWQRDLTNSSLLRNVGVAFAHSLIAYKAIQKGLEKLEINEDKIETDLDQNWAVLAEAVQTVMRKHGIVDPYTQLKEFTRGKQTTKDMLHAFIRDLNIPVEDKERLLELTPATYIGYLKESPP